MTALIVLVSVLIVLVAVDRSRVLFDDRRAAGSRPRVLINMDDDTAVEGVLWRTTSRWLIVRAATLHQHGKPTPVDGEMLIPRAGVAFVQKVT